GRVRRIEAVILVRIVDVEPQAETQPFMDRPLLRKRGLAPDDAGRLESVAAERPWREGVGVAEAGDVEIALLSGEGEAVRPEIDVFQLHLFVRRDLNRAARTRQVQVGAARE